MIGEDKSITSKESENEIFDEPTQIVKTDTSEMKYEDYGYRNTKAIVDFLKSMDFQNDVCEAFEKARITGFNIPELIDREFLKAIGITTIGDLGSISRLFRMIIGQKN